MDLQRSASDVAWSWFSPQLKRKSLGLILPREQLKLPFFLGISTVGFAGLFALQSYLAFGRLYTMTLSVAPASFEELISDQLGDFAVVTSVIAVAYMAVMLTNKRWNLADSTGSRSESPASPRRHMAARSGSATIVERNSIPSRRISFSNDIRIRSRFWSRPRVLCRIWIAK